jgi:hypothetical protein
VIDALRVTVVVYAVGLAVGLGVTALIGRPRSVLLDAALVMLGAAVLGQGVIDAALLVTGHDTDELTVHLGYLLTSVAILPVLAVIAGRDHERWGTTVFAVGCFVLSIVSFRLDQTFTHA